MWSEWRIRPDIAALVAAAATSADASSADGGFAGKVGVIRVGESKRIAVRIHGDVREVRAFPRPHRRDLHLGAAGAGQQRDGGENAEGTGIDFHGTEAEEGRTFSIRR